MYSPRRYSPPFRYSWGEKLITFEQLNTIIKQNNTTNSLENELSIDV
jgi:hypothetical protein